VTTDPLTKTLADDVHAVFAALAADVPCDAPALARSVVAAHRGQQADDLPSPALSSVVDAARGARPGLRGLYAIVDATASSDFDDVVTRARAVADGGACLVQLRMKGLTDRRALVLARATREALSSTTARFIVNDRADLAVAARADGVHVGTDDLPLDVVRSIVGDDAIVGRSAHTLADLDEGLAAGSPSYLAFGPVFLSTTKSGHAPVTGLARLAEAARHVALPLCAIGGVQTPLDAARAAASGASLVAAISAFAHVDDPRAMALRFVVSIALAEELTRAHSR